MADNWLAPDTCGVKLAQFEQMTQDMTKAGPQLEALAAQLWRILHDAGVSTAPAMEIKRLAAWVHEASTDLRRRNTLAHDLDRQNLAIEVCRLDGTYLTLPDRPNDQVAYGEGRRLAALLQRAAAGDAKAMADLRRYDPKDVTPALAKAVVQALGAEGTLRLPIDLSRRLILDVHQKDGDTIARDTRNILAILGRSLALTSHPGRSSYVGDDYFTQLAKAGRTTFPPGTTPPRGAAGYQSLSTLINAAGDTRFSSRFMETVGRDMILYDRGVPKNLAPLPELSGHYDLGNALDPATTKVTVGDRKTDYMIPLLNAAAASGREGAQALLGRPLTGPQDPNTPAAAQTPDLGYLLSTRRNLWAQTDHGAALGKTIKVAAIGPDKDSQRLAFAAAKILATDARKFFVVTDGDNPKLVAVDESGKLVFFKQLGGAFIGVGSNKKALEGYAKAFNPILGIDALSDLRPYMAEILSARTDKLHDLIKMQQINQPSSTGMTDADLDYLLLELTRDAKSFDILLRSQIAHAAVAIDTSIRNRQDLKNAITAEGWMFGHLLEARLQSLDGEKVRLAEELARVQGYVGLFTGKAVEQAQAATAGIPAAGEAFNLVSRTNQELTKMISQGLVGKPDPAIMASTTNTEATEKLFNQMIVSSLITHGRYDPKDLKDRPFAITSKGEEPKMLPFEKLDPTAREALIRWANDELGLTKHLKDAKGAIQQGKADTSGHFKNSNGNNVAPSSQR